MAKSRVAIVSKTPATQVSNRTPAQPAPELMLPASVSEVLYNIQNRMFEVNAILVCIHAQAEAKDCDSEVRWAIEAALKLFDSVIDSIEPASVKREAAEREG